ncbi:vWA domain-containing protein [Nannocystis punicea]|uniref:VWA domain-containing protein n=1 Tax=Nannocystis punicea TaxID=2995304 RepID=A0ABY7HI96_9BACT|nr:VWA domain-containing protein [Nannocystis poenicansa]WAS99044.1 VWA domain-containing protein [Nannocystis poenicansa]
MFATPYESPGGALFLEFFYALRSRGVPVSTHNWLALVDALSRGLHQNSLDGFYQVARCLLVSSEVHYDEFDRVFGQVFRGVEADLRGLLAGVEAWLQDPKALAELDEATRAALKELDLETLRQELLDRLKRQKERHDGGNTWVGTGGTSPFGQGGQNPAGIRVGGQGGGRSALAVADARRFQEFRKDVVLDTRQIAAALRRLRRLSREDGKLELDLDETIDATARNCGDIEVVLTPERHSQVRTMLLLDVGGSMDPHAHLVSRLFSAAHQGGRFKELRSYYFHNCVYGRVYEDAQFRKPVLTSNLLRELDHKWTVILVGDAYMHPGELTMTSGDWWESNRGPSGLSWLARIADRFPRSVWLNPEQPGLWRSGTIAEIARVFPMFQLTLSGLDDMVKFLRRPTVSAERRMLIQRLARAA